ncbi:MAG TPA: hypothetical protein VF384_08560 [Planctomycetota bacterium]
MRMLSTLVPSVWALCVSLAAQEAVAPFRFVPGDSCVVVRVAAPAKWKKQFAKTNVVKLFDGETLAPLIAQAGMMFDASLEQLRGSGKFDVDLLQSLLKDYTGDIVFSLQIDFSDADAALKADRPPAMSMVFALTPDGSYDLGALATALSNLIENEEQNRRPLKDLTVGDLRLRVAADGPMQGSVPFLHEGHLVMLMASDLEKEAARLLGTADRYEGQADARPLSAHAKLDGLVDLLMKAVTARMEEGGAPFDVKQMLQDLGVGSMKSMSVALGAEDKHLVGELKFTVGEGERGMFGALMLDQARPKLLRLVPANSESFSVSAFDAGAVFQVVRSIWEHMGEMVPITFEKAMEAFTETTKVKLQEELLAHLGTEMLAVGDADAQLDAAALADSEDPTAMLAGSCFGLALRNGKAFEESLEKVLRSRGLHAGRKSEDYADAKVHRMTLGGMLELEYVVTDDLLLIALGKDEASRRNLRAVLDARAKQGEGGEFVPAVATHIAAVPAGWSGVGITPVSQGLEGASAMFDVMPEMRMIPGMQQILPVLKGLAGDLKRFGLQHAVGTTYTSARSFEYRARW